MSSPVQCSAVLRNETADFLGTRENHVGPIAHHAGRHDGRRALLRTSWMIAFDVAIITALEAGYLGGSAVVALVE
jgi:hypothetical protein